MKPKILLLCNLIFIFLLFMLGNMMTTTPGHISGNGNPAILLFVPLFVLLVLLVSQWFYIFKNKQFTVRTLLIALFVLACHWPAAIYYQLFSYRNYRDLLAQVYAENFGYTDWEYINSITSGLSIHINNQFFNWNTYLLFINFSLMLWLIGCLGNMMIKRKLHG